VPLFRALLYPVLAVAALTSLLLWRVRAYRPVIAFLGLALAQNAAQNRLAVLLVGRHTGEHHEGPALAALRAAQALDLAYPLGVLAIAWWALWPWRRGRVPWLPAALWLGFTAACWATYAAQNPDIPSPLFERTQDVVAVGWLALGALWAWQAAPNVAPSRVALAGVEPLPLAALVLGAGEAAMLGGPFILGRPVEDWERVIYSRGPAWAALAVLHIAAWARTRRRG